MKFWMQREQVLLSVLFKSILFLSAGMNAL